MPCPKHDSCGPLAPSEESLARQNLPTGVWLHTRVVHAHTRRVALRSMQSRLLPTEGGRTVQQQRVLFFVGRRKSETSRQEMTRVRPEKITRTVLFIISRHTAAVGDSLFPISRFAPYTVSHADSLSPSTISLLRSTSILLFSLTLLLRLPLRHVPLSHPPCLFVQAAAAHPGHTNHGTAAVSSARWGSRWCAGQPKHPDHRQRQECQ